MNCPKCNSEYILKNGRSRSQKQNFKCRDCGRQFVMSPRHQPISSATKKLIDRLLLEKISLAGIVRATGVSSRWLQYYVNQKLGAVKREVEVKSKKKGKLTIDEFKVHLLERKTHVRSQRPREVVQEIYGLLLGPKSCAVINLSNSA